MEYIDVILSILAGVGVVGVAVTYFAKLWEWYKKPNLIQDKKLVSIEERLKKIEDIIERDNERLNKTDGKAKIEMNALLGMIDHMITGDHIEDLIKIRKELYDHIVNNY